MSAPAALRWQAVRKTFGPVLALDDVELELAPGSLTALVGPSGCGKSTLLTVTAGLLGADGGDVRLDGRSLCGVPAERRPVALVFQRPLLFPHLSVQGNVEFGLRMHRVPRAERRARAVRALADVELDGFGPRSVAELSGGQEQRVALARALVLEPRVLLLDEPFSQLDTALRAGMRRLVRELHDARGLTTVFVTHDRAEAVEVADTIAVLLAGRLVGHGPPQTFYRHPPSLATARFFGVTNEIAGTVTDGRFRAGPMQVPTDLPSGPSVLVIRPEAIEVAESAERAGLAERCSVTGTVQATRFAGGHVEVQCDTALGALTTHVPVDAAPLVGRTVVLRLPADRCTVLRDGPG